MTKGGEKNKMNARELTLDILLEIVERGGLSHVVLTQALSKYQYLEKQTGHLSPGSPRGLWSI